jgi:hypothetical protein
MKRSFSSMDSVPDAEAATAAGAAGGVVGTGAGTGGGPAVTPRLKRAHTDLGLSAPSTALSTTDNVLKAQNRALGMELAKRRRDLEQLQWELEEAVARGRVKEAEFIGANAILSEVS